MGKEVFRTAARYIYKKSTENFQDEATINKNVIGDLCVSNLTILAMNFGMTKVFKVLFYKLDKFAMRRSIRRQKRQPRRDKNEDKERKR